MPLPLERDSLVYLQELDVDRLARSTLGMRFALLVELVATAARPQDVLVYDPIGAVCMAPGEVRALMDWRDMLDLLDSPLPLEKFATSEDPDFPGGILPDTGGNLITSGAPLAAPGQQTGHPWLWSLGMLTFAATAAWLLWR